MGDCVGAETVTGAAVGSLAVAAVAKNAVALELEQECDSMRAVEGNRPNVEREADIIVLGGML